MPSSARSLLLVIIALTFLVIDTPQANAASDRWVSIGPSGGSIVALASPESNPNIVYVGTNGGIFKSTNGGDSWVSVNDGIDVRFRGYGRTVLTIDPHNPDIVYAGVGNSFCRSTSGGRSWIRLNDWTRDARVLLVDPSNPATIYAGLVDGEVLKSNDGGASWKKMQAGLTGSSVFAMAIDPSRASIYVSTTDGLFKSTNGGESSNSNTRFSKSNIISIVFHPSSSNLVYAATPEDGLFASANGGDDWSKVNVWPPRINTIALSADGGVLYVAHDFGVEMSSDAGASWTHAGILANVRLIHAGPSNTVFAGSVTGVFKSVDGGAVWKAAGGGIHGTHVTAIAIDPSNAKTMYAGESSSGLFKSTDGGVAWKLSKELANKHVTAIAIDPSESRTIYVIVDFRLNKSTDGGDHWTAAGALSYKLRSIALDPSNSRILYVCTWDGPAFRSTDGGARWSAVNVDPVNTTFCTIKIDPFNPKTAYASAARAGIYKSTDGGATWAPANNRLLESDKMPDLIELEIDSSSGALYAAGEGVFRTNDGGASWTKLTGDARNLRALAVDPSNPKTIYFGSESDGVFRSIDGGKTWTKLNDGLTTVMVESLAISSSRKGQAYAGTAGGGIFQLDSTAPRASTEIPRSDPSVPRVSHEVPRLSPTVPRISTEVPGLTPTVPRLHQIPADRPARQLPDDLLDDDDDEDDESNGKVINMPVARNRVQTVEVARPSVAHIEHNSPNAQSLPTGRVLSLPTGPILVVRYNGKFAAVQALVQSHRYIHYAWWYQPDGSGSFMNEHVSKGGGTTVENHTSPSPALKVVPFEISWSVGPRGTGWVYYRNPDLPDVVYEFALTDATEIRNVDVSKLSFSGGK